MGERKYCVYKHTFPNGKVYIGITSKNPEKRWNNGIGYSDNKEMFETILRYGWDNITHEVLASGLNYDNAATIERELIINYEQNEIGKTYNKDFAIPSIEDEYDVGEVIRKIMEEKKVRPFNLARRLGISKQALNGRITQKNISINILKDILRMMDYKIVIAPRDARCKGYKIK